MAPMHSLVADRAGNAAAEMALVLPLLLVLMFGTFELGHYFYSEHIVQKAVRDAARYASRLPITNYPACVPTAGAEQQIRRVARTGAPDGSTSARLRGWTADSMTTVTVVCDTSGTYAGIYTVYPFPDGVPTVTVAATVPYMSLFGALGLGNPSLNMRAESEAAVFAQ
jgi:Flp pilus assembly protein TadG